MDVGGSSPSGSTNIFGRVYPVRKYLKGLGTRTREGQRRPKTRERFQALAGEIGDFERVVILRSKITESLWVHFFVGRVHPVRKYLKGLGDSNP